MNTKVLFSSERSDWETPPEFFKKLDDEFHFTLDVCADELNHKCSRYFNKASDGLAQVWGTDICWLNPPYGSGVSHWIGKASRSAALGACVVALLPARTDTRWFHSWIYNHPNVEIRFLPGRLKFVGAKYAAPFPSMVVIFRHDHAPNN